MFIQKKININNFKEEDFQRDLEYISELYKEYEARYGSLGDPIEENKNANNINSVTYEQINEKMLDIVEEIGKLAEAIKELKNT